MPRPITNLCCPEFKDFINDLSDEAYDVIEDRWLDAQSWRTQEDFERVFLWTVSAFLWDDEQKLGCRWGSESSPI